MTNQTFLALQCVQCSTMQVKQQKKSSNKWTCVVCNQKQSLTRVFARGPVAKDVRGFVQGFNMARAGPGREEREEYEEEGCGVVEVGRGERKRRTDWSEYLDRVDRGGGEEDDEGEIESEQQFVTEMPKDLPIKRPSKRSLAGVEPRHIGPQSSQVSASRFLTEKLLQHPQVERLPERIPSAPTAMKKMKVSSSKWSEYLENEMEKWSEVETYSQDPSLLWKNDRKEDQYRDVEAEEEIHPDFV